MWFCPNLELLHHKSRHPSVMLNRVSQTTRDSATWNSKTQELVGMGLSISQQGGLFSPFRTLSPSNLILNPPFEPPPPPFTFTFNFPSPRRVSPGGSPGGSPGLGFLGWGLEWWGPFLSFFPLLVSWNFGWFKAAWASHDNPRAQT